MRCRNLGVSDTVNVGCSMTCCKSLSFSLFVYLCVRMQSNTQMKMLRIKLDVENTDHSSRQRRGIFCTCVKKPRWFPEKVLARMHYANFSQMDISSCALSNVLELCIGGRIRE